MRLMTAILFLGMALGSACASPGTTDPTETSPATVPAADSGPGHALWTALRPYCGRAFEGELTSARGGDGSFRDQAVVMDIRHCEGSRMLIPLHVGDDHSRTWVLERHAWGVTLKHQHRDPDGSEQQINLYGGLARPPADGTELAFPVDDETLAMLPNSRGGYWTIRVDGDVFQYQVQRRGVDEVFQLTFDLNTPIEQPDAPWGWERFR
ncbi:hypothetical protein [Natronospira bacteriovora]|uniref:Lipoprotein n=1 Tax=Natronospira bacteriovora TaxID=3069753 RepID=A0ABU0W5U2_9GAMM|nr:hypothetical protein [Natronospira sp. AB-CW4]MDQ2068385.1 hypothetical protein [Natronospira sp. AB-CW4]